MFLVIGVLLWIVWFLFSGLLARPILRWQPVQTKPGGFKSRKKAAWVIKEVIRLKALMFSEGCRTVASAFNARFGWQGETVGKTFVAETLKRHQQDVLVIRRKLNRRKRKKGPKNRVWGMDMTFASNGSIATPVLGIIDHGTRRLLCLESIRDRTSIGILRFLLHIIQLYGRPIFLRTDNEPIFNSRLLLFALWILGIRKQTTDPFCPWQNGRIERLFRTLKERLYPYWEKVGIPDNIQVDLKTFHHWYNLARSHQSLSGLTPEMAWFDKTHEQPPRFFSAWDGMLTGWIPPP